MCVRELMIILLTAEKIIFNGEDFVSMFEMQLRRELIIILI